MFINTQIFRCAQKCIDSIGRILWHIIPLTLVGSYIFYHAIWLLYHIDLVHDMKSSERALIGVLREVIQMEIGVKYVLTGAMKTQ